MSDAFKNLDYGNQAQNLIQQVNSRDTKLAALDKSRTTRGTIEENVGMLKELLVKRHRTLQTLAPKKAQ